MKMIKIFTLIACGLMLSLSQGFAKDPANTECPVKGKKVDSKSKMIDVEVGFCCKKCKAKFDKDVLAGRARPANFSFSPVSRAVLAQFSSELRSTRRPIPAILAMLSVNC